MTSLLALFLNNLFLILLIAFIEFFKGIAFKAGMIEASMPTAVMSIVLATEFDTNPRCVTSAVLTSTILNPITLTPVLAFLGV